MISENVNHPNDLKNLSIDEMTTLADKIKEIIIKKVNATGGQMALNLGIINTKIAMHYVFNRPNDKIVFDVTQFQRKNYRILRYFRYENINYEIKKEYTERIPLKEIYSKYRLNNNQITEDIEKVLNKISTFSL